MTLAKSAAFPEDRVAVLAAITCGLSSLMDGAARIFDGGRPAQAMVEMQRGLMLVKAVSDGAVLAALVASECDIDLVAYEMTLLVEEVGEVLTPSARVTLACLARRPPHGGDQAAYSVSPMKASHRDA
jgi:predicted regulator of Ras-like GTPase activity (Roadblock/LC7/MglB family)